MALEKMYVEDVIGGGLTAAVGAATIAFANKHGYLHNLEELLTVAVFIAAIFYLTKFVTRWICFLLFSKIKESCGLFIENYMTGEPGHKVPVIAPMIVYFDLAKDELMLRGHAFRIAKGDRLTFAAYARWHSLVVHHKPRRDDISVFYLHDGELIGEENDDVPGVTFCRLPKRSTNRCRRGYFCDLVEMDSSAHKQTGRATDGPVYKTKDFELVRASAEMEKKFFAKIPRPIERMLCRLRIASPGEDAFAKFVHSHGKEFFMDQAIERGLIMVEAQKILDVKS